MLKRSVEKVCPKSLLKRQGIQDQVQDGEEGKEAELSGDKNILPRASEL